MGSYTLGLDVGSRSIGWALIGKSRPSIVDLGVRVFPEGVDRDTKGAEKSKNATRREARGSRRNRRRFHKRRDKLVAVLQKTGCLPEDKGKLEELLKTEPYQIRARGLDDKIELYEFGRALFHINQRRGFKSNRKTGDKSDNNKVAKAAGELQTKIDAKGFRTLGEYFASLNPEDNRIREQYTFRSMYEKEFDLLWSRQSEFYPEILTEDFRKQIRDEIIFYQRPLKPTDDLIGDCDLEEGEKRCPRGDWYARKFRLLQDVNNLRIHNPDGSEQKLTDNQRQLLLSELSQKKDMKYDAIRKKLGLIETQEFNLEEGGKVKSLKGDEFAWAMRSKNVFGTKVWDGMDEEEKIQLNTVVLELDDDELTEKMISEYSFTEEQAGKVLKVSLPQRYMSFSRKAIQKLLPKMEEGKRTDEALEEVYPDRNKEYKGEAKDRLDMPEDLRNPIVNKALIETRKVVNAIIREYGKPAKINLEMARDVKGSLRERQELQFKMRENERINENARKRLQQDMNIINPKRDDIIKYKLWEECGKRCPYTGKMISQSALFGSNPEFQIEHILPYSRSLDDSYMNKTLCCVNENRIKGNQTPYEFYSDDDEKYEQIRQRIKVLPWPKRRKFLQKEIMLDECISRELNDTRYICKEVVKYLKKIGITVRGTKGRVTSELRHCWGLNNILDLTGSDMKNRDDHRHHVIDAVVTAVTKKGHLRNLAKSKYSTDGIPFEEPWPDFREELEEKIKHINVSHRVIRKVSGKLHKDTNYGITGKKDRKGQGIYVYRKPLELLTKKMTSEIVDPVVKKIVQKRIESVGGDMKEAFAEPLYMKTVKSNKKVPIKKVRIEDVSNNMIMLNDKDGNPYRAVAPGNNHHIEIFEYKDKKGNLKRDGKVITLYEAVKRKRYNEHVIQRNHGADKKFVCSLATNEMFMLELDDGSKVLHRVQKLIQDGRIVLRPHTYAGKVSDSDKPPLIQRRSVGTLKGCKVTVDPLGRIHRAND